MVNGVNMKQQMEVQSLFDRYLITFNVHHFMSFRILSHFSLLEGMCCKFFGGKTCDLRTLC